MNEVAVLMPYSPFVHQKPSFIDMSIDWMECSLENINKEQWSIIQKLEIKDIRQFIYNCSLHYRILEQPTTKLCIYPISVLLLRKDDAVLSEWNAIFATESVFRNPKLTLCKFVIETIVENIQSKIRSRSPRIFSEKD
jgi:hypothetical protein